MRRIILAWLYALVTSLRLADGNKACHSDVFGRKSIICYTALFILCSTSLWYSNPKDSLPSFPSCYLSYTMNQ